MTARNPFSILIFAIVVIVCASAGPAWSQAFSADEVRRYNIGPVNAPAYLSGFDSATLRTRPSCTRARSGLVSGTTGPATSNFRYIRSVDEIFQRQKLAVGARVAVKYMGVGASVDTRYSQISTSSQHFENGAIYGYFERVDPIRFRSAPRIRLTQRAQRIHDEAVMSRNMAAFYEECGDEVIVGKQMASYVQVIGTYSFEEGMSETEKSLAVEASVKVATGVLDVSAETSVEQDQTLREAFSRTDVNTNTVFTGNPVGCAAPSKALESAAAFFECFTAQDDRLTADLHAIYTVRYQDVIQGFGRLPDVNISEDREADVYRILNALSLHELALLEIEGRSDLQHSNLRRDYEQLVTRFVREGGCLMQFGPYCENLLVRLRSHPPAVPGNARDMVSKLIELDRRCGSGPADVTAWPMVSGNGFLACRRCGIGLVPVFIDGRNGQCGLPIAPPEPNVARFFADDLKRPARVPTGSDTGSTSVVRDTNISNCTTRGDTCGTPRANAICEDLGFERMRRFKTAKYHTTVYSDGKLCQQWVEDSQLVPQSCRTFSLLDCACPARHQAVGRSCVFVPDAVSGVAIEWQLNTDPDDGDDEIGLTARPGLAERQPFMILEGIRLPAQTDD